MTLDLVLWCSVQVDSSLSCLVKCSNSSEIEYGWFDFGENLLQEWHGSSWWELFCSEIDCSWYRGLGTGCYFGTDFLFWALSGSGSFNPGGG